MAGNQKSIFIRFNMDDETDRKLYLKLVKGAVNGLSLTAYAKRALDDHFSLSIKIADRQEFHSQILSEVREAMQEQGMQQSDSKSVSKTGSKGILLQICQRLQQICKQISNGIKKMKYAFSTNPVLTAYQYRNTINRKEGFYPWRSQC